MSFSENGHKVTSWISVEGWNLLWHHLSFPTDLTHVIPTVWAQLALDSDNPGRLPASGSCTCLPSVPASPVPQPGVWPHAACCSGLLLTQVPASALHFPQPPFYPRQWTPLFRVSHSKLLGPRPLLILCIYLLLLWADWARRSSQARFPLPHAEEGSEGSSHLLSACYLHLISG
jgi:hypothetical protein